MSRTLYYNGTILTMEEPLYAEALLEEDGIIRAVGGFEELKAAAGAREGAVGNGGAARAGQERAGPERAARAL